MPHKQLKIQQLPQGYWSMQPGKANRKKTPIFRWVDDLLYVYSHTNAGSLKTKWAMEYAILVWPITGAPLPPHQEDGSRTQDPQTPSSQSVSLMWPWSPAAWCDTGFGFPENWGCPCNQTVCISLQETACSRDYNTSTEDMAELGTEVTAHAKHQVSSECTVTSRPKTKP